MNCQHCGKKIAPLFKLPPDVKTTKDGKEYTIVHTGQMPKKTDSRWTQTETIPVYFVQEVK